MTHPEQYYDGHHHEYNLGFFVAVDCHGIARYIHGPLPGACNDIQIYETSDMSLDPTKFFFDLNGTDMVLFDGIYRYLPNRFLCAIFRQNGDRQLTRREKHFNKLHRRARALVKFIEVYG